MSSSSAATVNYFCHPCDRPVAISSDLLCPFCRSDFVEELQLPPNPNPLNATDFAGFLSFLASALPPPPPPSDLNPNPFNPLEFIQDYLTSVLGAGDVSISLGDYFIGGNLEQLIEHLAENDPNRYGTPPAAKAVVDSLPDVEICENVIKNCGEDEDDGAACAVCKDDFVIGDRAKEMPCKHLYHEGCILPWLEMHNSCPVCRFELATDDEEYEKRKRGERVGLAVVGGWEGEGGSGNGSGSGVVERRYTIQLPGAVRNDEGGGGNGGETRQDHLD